MSGNTAADGTAQSGYKTVSVEELAREAKRVAPLLAKISTAVKNRVLIATAGALVERADEILAANEKDVEAARATGMSEAMVDRLALGQQLSLIHI